MNSHAPSSLGDTSSTDTAPLRLSGGVLHRLCIGCRAKELKTGRTRDAFAVVTVASAPRLPIERTKVFAIEGHPPKRVV